MGVSNISVIDRVLDIARSQIGVTEIGQTNSVKYNTAYYGQNVYDGLWGCTFPWCVTFLWWVFREADASKYFYGGRKTANCGTLADYYMDKGQFIRYGYKRGDIVFFEFSTEFQHVGIIESVNKDGTYTCIEGNTSLNGSQDNGGSVCSKIRYLMNICGAARWYNEDEEMTIDDLKKLLKSATAEQRKEIGKELDSCVSEYRKELPCPDWAKEEWASAQEHGITDGSRPMTYGTRLEAGIMCDRAVYGKK